MYRTVCALFLVGGLAGCAADDAMATSCVEGSSVACTCTDGRQGAQSCGTDGTLGVCACDAVPGAAEGVAGAGAVPTATSDPGAAGSPMEGDAPGEPAMPEQPAEPAPGEMDPPAEPPPADNSGPGSDGSGDNSGSGSDNSGPGSGDVISGLFGRCQTDEQCDGDLACLMGGAEQGYCAEPCSGGFFAGAGGADCTQPEGDVPITCAVLTGLCTLGNCAGDGLACPGDMHCTEQMVFTPFGASSSGQCAYQ